MQTNPYDKHPNAQKWTAEKVTELLTKIDKDAREGDSFFLGIALFKLGLYRQVWTYWKRTFVDNEDIIELMLGIETAFEAKLVDGALKKKISPYIAYLALKNGYNWSDRPDKVTSRSLHNRSNN